MLKIARIFRYGIFDISEADFLLWNADSDKKVWLGEIVDKALLSPDKNVDMRDIKITIEIEEIINRND